MEFHPYEKCIYLIRLVLAGFCVSCYIFGSFNMAVLYCNSKDAIFSSYRCDAILDVFEVCFVMKHYLISYNMKDPDFMFSAVSSKLLNDISSEVSCDILALPPISWSEHMATVRPE